MNQQILESKQNTVKEIVEKAQASQSVTIAEYRGLTVAQIQELRRALRAEGAEMCVYKNSLVSRAAKELGWNGLDEILTGPNAIIFSQEMSNGPKVVNKYSRRFRQVLVLKGGVVEDRVLDKEKMVEVAKMPGREGLLSMFLSCLQAPVRQFACAVQAIADAKSAN